MPYASSSMRVMPYKKSVRLRNRGRHEAGSCRRLSSDAQIPKAANVAFRQSQAFRRRGCRTARLLRFPGHPPGAAVSSRPRRTSTFRSFARISSGLALLAMSQGHNRSRDSLEYRATFLGRQTTFPLAYGSAARASESATDRQNGCGVGERVISGSSGIHAGEAYRQLAEMR